MAQLSPADRQRIIRTYAQTGNGLETARRCGFSEATVRRVIAQAKVTNKIELHARATQRGIREGRKGLRTCTRIVQRYLADCESDKDLEPQDVAKLVSAQAQATRGLCDVQARHEQHALSRMNRRLKQVELELTQAKLELAKLDIANGGTQRVQHTVDAQVAIVELPALDTIPSAGTVASESGTADPVSSSSGE